jgi:hypothetical protein
MRDEETIHQIQITASEYEQLSRKLLKLVRYDAYDLTIGGKFRGIKG